MVLFYIISFMGRKIYILFFTCLLSTSIVIYNVKANSRLHLMKFSGDFSIAYGEKDHYNNDAFYEQLSTFESQNINISVYNSQIFYNFDQNNFPIDTHYLMGIPRAPPLYS